MSLSAEDKSRVKPIIFHPYTSATVLYAVAVRLFGEEMHGWEPETLALEFKDEFGEELPKINQDKLNALISAVVGPGFYHDWTTFMMIAQTLNHGEDPMDMGDPLLVAEMAWAVTEVQLNDDTPGIFSESVCAFVGKVLEEEGFVTPIHPLDFAKMPYRYTGSDTAADENKAETIQTMHAQVVIDYLNEQAALLLRHIAALPWQTPESVETMVSELREAAR